MNSGAQDAVQTGYTKRHRLPARRSLERHAHGAEQHRVGVEPERVLLPVPVPTLRVILLIVRVVSIVSFVFCEPGLVLVRSD